MRQHAIWTVPWCWFCCQSYLYNAIQLKSRVGNIVKKHIEVITNNVRLPATPIRLWLSQGTWDVPKEGEVSLSFNLDSWQRLGQYMPSQRGCSKSGLRSYNELHVCCSLGCVALMSVPVDAGKSYRIANKSWSQAMLDHAGYCLMLLKILFDIISVVTTMNTQNVNPAETKNEGLIHAHSGEFAQGQ